MDMEREIERLLNLAAPLRALDDDDPAKAPLAGIIDKINDLRRQQAEQTHFGQSPMENPRLGPNSTRKVDPNAVVEGADAALPPIPEPAKRKPGPKPGAKRAAKVKP